MWVILESLGAEELTFVEALAVHGSEERKPVVKIRIWDHNVRVIVEAPEYLVLVLSELCSRFNPSLLGTGSTTLFRGSKYPNLCGL